MKHVLSSIFAACALSATALAAFDRYDVPPGLSRYPEGAPVARIESVVVTAVGDSDTANLQTVEWAFAHTNVYDYAFETNQVISVVTNEETEVVSVVTNDVEVVYTNFVRSVLSGQYASTNDVCELTCEGHGATAAPQHSFVYPGQRLLFTGSAATNEGSMVIFLER